jgi:hypothetical protein
MAVESPGFVFVQSGGETAERARRALAAYAGGRGGIVAAGDLAVTENGTPNMSVNVATGQVIIPGTEGSFQGSYVIENRGTLNVVIAASDATNPRKDLIVCKVQDAAYSGASNVASIVVVTGTPAGSPAEPAVPANAWVLAMVDVPALDTAITNSQITDRRASATNSQAGRAAALGGVIFLPTGAGAFPAHQEGRQVYEQSSKKLLISDGTAWTSPKNQPQGILGVTRTTSSVGPTSGTTELDVITAPAVTPSAANRRIRIRAQARGLSGGTVSDQFVVRIKEGATELADDVLVFTTGSITNPGFDIEAIVDSPTAAAHTYKVTITRTAGTGTVSVAATATSPILITVEDAGGI